MIIMGILKSMPDRLQHFPHMPAALAGVLCAALCITFSAHAEGTGRIVKWKDEKGVTHYGDSIPPQYSNRDNALMNKQGITIQQNKPNAHEDSEAMSAKLEQDKKDRALLGTFTNADEIDLTRDRNLEPELLMLKNLQQDRAVAQGKVDQSSAKAAAFVKTKKPVPANISEELKTSKEALSKIDQRIADRQHSIDAIRKRFEEDKKRYQVLKGQSPATPAGVPQ